MQLRGANDGCSLGATPCGAMQLQCTCSPACGTATLGPRGACEMYGPWRLQSMNVNNDRTAKRAHRSPCDGCAIVVESERAEGLQWLDGSRYYPTRTNRR